MKNVEKTSSVFIFQKQGPTELGLNGKVRIPLRSFWIESEGSGRFAELVPIHKYLKYVVLFKEFHKKLWHLG